MFPLCCSLPTTPTLYRGVSDMILTTLHATVRMTQQALCTLLCPPEQKAENSPTSARTACNRRALLRQTWEGAAAYLTFTPTRVKPKILKHSVLPRAAIGSPVVVHSGACFWRRETDNYWSMGHGLSRESAPPVPPCTCFPACCI